MKHLIKYLLSDSPPTSVTMNESITLMQKNAVEFDAKLSISYEIG